MINKRSRLNTKQIEAILIEAGIRPSAQRIVICKYVLCQADHPTAEEVKVWADENFLKLSLATVYNTLNLLVEKKLLKHIKLSHSEKVFFDFNTHPHIHFVDTKTGKLVDLDPDVVRIEWNLPDHYQVEEMDVVLRGEIHGSHTAN